MVVFLLGAIIGAAFCRLLSLPRQVSNRAKSSVVADTLASDSQAVAYILFFLGFVSLILLGLAVYSLETGALIAFSRFVSDPVTAQALLGIFAGVASYNFSRLVHAVAGLTLDPTHDRSMRVSRWGLLIVSTAIAVIILAGLLAPYATSILDRTTGVETPYLKVQFAAATSDKQLTLSIDRDLIRLDTIDTFPQSVRFLQYDCAQVAIENGGLTEFKGTDPYKFFVNAIAMRNDLSSFSNLIFRVINGPRNGYSTEILNARVQPLAERLFQLVSDPVKSRFSANYEAAIATTLEANDLLSREGISNEIPVEEQDRREQDRDPPWCREDVAKVTTDDAWDVLQHTRSLYGLAATLLGYVGDRARVIVVMSIAKKIAELEKDINVNDSLAAALYLDGRDLAEVTALNGIALSTIERNDGQLDKAKRLATADSEILEKLQARYKRARYRAKLQLAYLWAQEAITPNNEQNDVRLADANRYVEEGYRAFQEGKTSSFTCTDAAEGLFVKDAFAYVKLASMTHELQTRKIAANQLELKRLRNLLEDARAEARDFQRRAPGTNLMLARNKIPPCVAAAEAKAWVQRLSTHLRLADALAR